MSTRIFGRRDGVPTRRQPNINRFTDLRLSIFWRYSHAHTKRRSSIIVKPSTHIVLFDLFFRVSSMSSCVLIVVRTLNTMRWNNMSSHYGIITRSEYSVVVFFLWFLFHILWANIWWARFKQCIDSTHLSSIDWLRKILYTTTMTSSMENMQ